MPYWVNYRVDVASGATLTIVPGAVVKLDYYISGPTYSAFDVDGALIAQGTAAQPIVFTSLYDDTVAGDTNGDGNATSPAASDWDEIQLNTGSTPASIFDHVDIRYAYYGLRATSQAAGVNVSNSSFSSCSGYGIYLSSITGGSITDSAFSNNGTGISLSNSTPLIYHNDFINNTTGLTNSTSFNTIDAEYNYWADASGPYDGSDDLDGFYNPGGTGDPVSDYVDYVPWLGQEQEVPTEESQLGEPPASGFNGDPVNTATGNYIHHATDLTIPGRGLNFEFKRFYNSQYSGSGPLGAGWTHSYNLFVNEDTENETITVSWGDGHNAIFDLIGGTYQPRYAGNFDILVKNPDDTYTVTQKAQRHYHFLTNGKLSSIADRNGNTISLVYDGSWKLTGIQDTVGRTTAFTYDGSDRITQITEPLARTVAFAYDGNNDLVSVTDLKGAVTSFTYDVDHRMLTAVDPRGNTFITNTYDGEGRIVERVIQQTDAKGNAFQFAYDEATGRTTITDPLGRTSVDVHDQRKRLIEREDALGNSLFFTYDDDNNRIEAVDKNGNVTAYSYDDRGNVTGKTDATGKSTSITYDSINNPLSRTDQLGNVTTYTYDANGNLLTATDALGNITTNTYDGSGQLLTTEDPLGNVTQFAYDSEGNLVSTTDELGNVMSATYDAAGRKLTETDPRGNVIQLAYDDNDTLLTITDAVGGVTTYEYDANKNRTRVTDAKGNATQFTHDENNLHVTTTDALGGVITLGYDAMDNKISTMDARGNTTTFEYDAELRLTRVTDPLGNETQYGYDAQENQTSVTDPLGNVIAFTYDVLNRRVSTTDALGNTSTPTYDALDKVTSTTNAMGQVTAFQYDALGQLIGVTDPGTGTLAYSYDANGNRVSVTDPNGNTTVYVYDAVNQLTQKTEPLGGSYHYGYDAAGNRTSQTDAKGQTITHAYDALNRRSSMTYPDASSVTFAYDANGNRISMTDAVGTSTYTYDALDRMASYTEPFGKTVGYGYDANGNRTSLVYPGGNTATYAFDAANRLATVTDWLAQATSYTYDAAGRLLQTTNPNGTVASNSYDAAGRLISLTNTKSDLTVISIYAYTLDALGNHQDSTQQEPLVSSMAQKLKYSHHDVENRLLSSGITTYTHDANGNMTGLGGDILTYDYADRLVQSNLSGVSSQYQYDGLGRRLAKTEAGATKRYVLDVAGRLPQVIAQTNNSGTPTAYYVYGQGLIERVLPDTTTHYYHYDPRGSAIALTDATESVTDAYAYAPFGAVDNSTGTTSHPFKYAGRYGVMDEDNGLQYIRARYYQPELGRFISKDPLPSQNNNTQNSNRYHYAYNNPVMLLDINGLSALSFGLNLFDTAGSISEKRSARQRNMDILINNMGDPEYDRNGELDRAQRELQEVTLEGLEEISDLAKEGVGFVASPASENPLKLIPRFAGWGDSFDPVIKIGSRIKDLYRWASKKDFFRNIDFRLSSASLYDKVFIPEQHEVANLLPIAGPRNK